MVPGCTSLLPENEIRVKPRDSKGADGRHSLPHQRANSLGRWSDSLGLPYVWKKLEGQLYHGLSSQDSRSLGENNLPAKEEKGQGEDAGVWEMP